MSIFSRREAIFEVEEKNTKSDNSQTAGTPKEWNFYDKPSEHFFSKKEAPYINTIRKTAIDELHLQQTRQAMIATLYILIFSLVIPCIVKMEIGDLAKACGFLLLSVTGIMLCHIFLHCRIYREVYMVACRTLSRLEGVEKELQCKREVIYRLFYDELNACQNSVIVRTEPKYSPEDTAKYGPLEQSGKTGKPSILKSFLHQANSPEALLYELIVIFSSAATMVSMIYLSFIWSPMLYIGIGTVIFILFFLNRKYILRLIALYKCIDDKLRVSFERTFNKAWMLRFFND